MSENVLERTKVYLVGPMEYSQGRSWREDIEKDLAALNILPINPYCKPFLNDLKEDEETHKNLYQKMQDRDFDSVHEHMKSVRYFDLHCVDHSTFIIAYINPDVPTYGSTDELQQAARMQRPIFLVVEGGITETPLWLMGMIKPQYIYDSFEDVMSVIKKIDSGEIALNPEKWKLFNKEYR
jgi:hypothetical protein